jgi:hypothetical protein
VCESIIIVIAHSVHAALATVTETVVVRVAGATCPIPFDTNAFIAAYIAQSAFPIDPSKVSVTLTCSLTPPGGRRLQSEDDAYFEIGVVVDDVTQIQATSVCGHRSYAAVQTQSPLVIVDVH